jgi:hypothetical protein
MDPTVRLRTLDRVRAQLDVKAARGWRCGAVGVPEAHDVKIYKFD